MRVVYSLLIFLFLTAQSVFASGACAHRADNRSAPENTIPSILSAVEKGAHQIEIDVQFSKDKKLVIMHDDTVDRTTNGSGKVADLTFDELRKLDAGSRVDPSFKGTKIPTLREALDVIPHEILCNVHVKGGPETSVQVAELIAEMGRIDHCFFSIGGSEANEAMAAARVAVPDIMICAGFRADETVTEETVSIKKEVLERYRKKYPGKKIDGHINIIQLFFWGNPVPYDNIKKSVATLHSYGTRVNHCCASTEETIRPLIEAGVDFIMTDNLDLCLDILAEYDVKPVKIPGVKK